MKEDKLYRFDFEQFRKLALDQLKGGQPLTGKEGVLTPLIKELLESALEGELDSHLSDCQEEGVSNRRNGKISKTLKTATGSFELNTPRDREGSFEPEIVKKRQTGECSSNCVTSILI